MDSTLSEMISQINDLGYEVEPHPHGRFHAFKRGERKCVLPFKDFEEMQFYFSPLRWALDESDL